MSGQHVVFVRSNGVAALERSVTERLDRLGLPRLPADAEHDGPSLRLQVLATPAGWVTMRASPCWFWWAPGSEEADLTAPHATWFEHLLGEDPALGRYSLLRKAARKAPRMNPGISGRRYWTTPAR